MTFDTHIVEFSDGIKIKYYGKDRNHIEILPQGYIFVISGGINLNECRFIFKRLTIPFERWKKRWGTKK